MTDIVTSPEAASAPSVATIGSQGLHEFLRYGFASLAALALDVSLLWFLTEGIGFSYFLSGAISFTAGLVLVYFLSVYWVFGARSVRSPAAEFAIFAVIGLLGLAFNQAILYLFTTVFGFYYLVSKIASVVVVFSWNFAARKWLLFRSQHA